MDGIARRARNGGGVPSSGLNVVCLAYSVGYLLNELFVHHPAADTLFLSAMLEACQ
jgi:hypothetical protein